MLWGMNCVKAESQKKVLVRYQGIVVGEYVTDILVEDEILVELKAVKSFEDAHIAPCLNYLNATNLKLCLLLNFGNSKVDIKRLVLD